MLQILLIWLYITIISTSVGYMIQKVCARIAKEETELSMTRSFIAGMVGLTVYVQIFSLFGKIGLVAQIMLLIITVLAIVGNRQSLWEMWKKCVRTMFSIEGLVSIGIILVCAFFTSRGTQHTDTCLYHAQAIRWLEEYGVVRGLGNLFENYAYNSSWLCYTALFSFKFLGGLSYHTTNGLIMAVMCIYAVSGLWSYKGHKSHITDALRFGILFYTVVICVVAMSPATDAPSMYLCLYIILRWCENLLEEKNSLHTYAMLCVLCVYGLTVKLSMGLLVLLVIWPAVELLKKKDWKAIGSYIGLGVIVLLPFLIRNVILSGWLIYPLASIDLFSVEWKIPVESLLHDSNQIKVYGRKTYDVSLISQKIWEWFPIWWEESENYDRGLFLSQILGICLMLSTFIKQWIRREKINWNLQLVKVTLVACLIGWLFTSPFVRYGLGYLLAIPLIALGEYQESKRVSMYKVIAVGIMVLMITSIAPYWNHYVMDTLLFVKNQVMEPYYIAPKDYVPSNAKTFEINGQSFYQIADPTTMLSYDAFPGTNYPKQLEFLGEDLGDGFKVVPQ